MLGSGRGADFRPSARDPHNSLSGSTRLGMAYIHSNPHFLPLTPRARGEQISISAPIPSACPQPRSPRPLVITTGRSLRVTRSQLFGNGDLHPDSTTRSRTLEHVTLVSIHLFLSLLFLEQTQTLYLYLDHFTQLIDLLGEGLSTIFRTTNDHRYLRPCGIQHRHEFPLLSVCILLIVPNDLQLQLKPTVRHARCAAPKSGILLL